MDLNKSLIIAFMAGFASCAADSVLAQDGETDLNERGSRFEVWLGVSNWPALAELQPAGAFDATGFALGAAFHMPVRRYASGDLLIGIDASLASNESSIEGLFGDLVARHTYLGVSAKYRYGAKRNLTLDGGLGYHFADIADINTAYYGFIENQVWESSALGVFVGTTWDFGLGMPERRNGWFVSLKAHFADFGEVDDTGGYFGPGLSGAAGSLDGPLYLLAFGYSGE